MSYQRDRDMTIAELARRNVPDESIRKLLRLATSLQRSAEINCSVPLTQQGVERWARRDESLEQRVRTIATGLGADVEFNGDPRGCPFALSWPSPAGPQFVRPEIRVPGRGYPWSELDAMIERANRQMRRSVA